MSEPIRHFKPEHLATALNKSGGTCVLTVTEPSGEVHEYLACGDEEYARQVEREMKESEGSNNG